ncbi:MAG: hypothetical protein ACYDH3_06195, partial [Candidatus Aminicenantales bacterium]
MNAREIARRMIGGSAAVLFAAGLGFSQEPPPNWTARDIEAFLNSAPIVAVDKDVETGRTMPWQVTLDDGRTRARALFKYIDRPNMQPTRHSYRFELAAYALSRLVNLEIVPPIVRRKVEDTNGALQWYLEGCRSERDRERLKEEPPDLPSFLDRLADVQVFEALTGEECGDKDDTLIHQDSWRICRVDFAGAFRPNPTIPEGCLLQRCSRELLERLGALALPELTAWLGPILDPEEITALDERRKQIVGIFLDLIRDKGEA